MLNFRARKFVLGSDLSISIDLYRGQDLGNWRSDRVWLSQIRYDHWIDGGEMKPCYSQLPSHLAISFSWVTYITISVISWTQYISSLYSSIFLSISRP
jgi:hypothetical protein